MARIAAEFLQIIKDFSLFDDVYMNCFFKDFPEGIQFILRKILDRSDLVVKSVHIQDVMVSMTSKTSRLDVFAEDGEGNQYDVEFQFLPNENIPKRGRYYLGNIDQNMIRRGEEYDTLHEAYVIFICAGDPIKKHKPMYHYTMKDEDGNELNDGQHLLILNADYEGDWRLKDLMNDIKASDPETMKYEVLKERAEYLKEEEEGNMQLNMNLQNLMMKAENKGIEKGREEEKTNMIFHMLKEKFDVKTIMRALNVSEETIKKSKRQCNEN
ncbi:Rpn family recombination-promoting nuclease/putative transposase [Dubosiella newyorkensis]|uniref:Rpn family recombination-promoting nuclease/putative transposase n=2 Tax=Dubosiella newyorkensis TaxID=1862672 RepID=UPI0023EFFDD0|nr:Rpn family recombination-promoting nuclease/putative transposase [Dubosiella newyorkensis]